MTGFYLEKAVFFVNGRSCMPHIPPPPLKPRHPTRELRGLQFENRDGDARRLALRNCRVWFHLGCSGR